MGVVSNRTLVYFTKNKRICSGKVWKNLKNQKEPKYRLCSKGKNLTQLLVKHPF